MIRGSTGSWNSLYRHCLKMLSRRAITILALVGVSLVILFLTSHRLRTWPSADEPYFHLPGHHATEEQAEHTSSQAAPAQSSRPSHLPLPVADEGDMPERPKFDPLCVDFPDTSGILLSMKTGATESFDRLPTQLMTALRCLPDFLLFSDMEQHIVGYHIHDALDTVLAEAKDNNPDFDLYRRQRACPVDQENCSKLGDPASEGWNLDKYKNIHMAEKAFAMRPGYDWYVFVDADTYVLWPNMVRWLSQLDPNDKHYLGSVTMINGFPFAHGGSGYILSKASMAAFVGNHPNIGNKYDVQAKSECCGDYLLAAAMKETSKIEVEQTWPTINGEKPNTLPFGHTHWCHPVVTMHHMNSEEISTFWDFERRHFWTPQKTVGSGSSTRRSSVDSSKTPRPLLLRDIYYEFLAPKLVRAREDWDNLADDIYYLDRDDPEHKWEEWQLGRTREEDEMNEQEKKAHKGFSECREACESVGDDQCFSFKWSDGICGFGRAFQLGKPKQREERQEKRSMSGWPVAKIEKWIAEQGDCEKVEWPQVET